MNEGRGGVYLPPFWLSRLEMRFSAERSCTAWGESLSLILRASKWLLPGINTELCCDFPSLLWWSTSADRNKFIPACEKWSEKMDLQHVSSLPRSLCLLGRLLVWKEAEYLHSLLQQASRDEVSSKQWHAANVRRNVFRASCRTCGFIHNDCVT